MKEVLADVTDAAVPVVFRDFHVMVIAEAQFSKVDRDKNVFYVGVFSKWFNLNAQLTTVALDLERSLVCSMKILYIYFYCKLTPSVAARRGNS